MHHLAQESAQTNTCAASLLRLCFWTRNLEGEEVGRLEVVVCTRAAQRRGGLGKTENLLSLRLRT